MGEILSHLGMGFQVAFVPANIFSATFGAFIGLIVGAMPGIGSLAGVALLLPMTFGLDPNAAIIMLAALYYSNMYGGAFSAILLNIPGDSPAVMTAIDGYKLSQKGKAGKALFTSIFASFIGGTIGTVILTVMGPALANVGLRFGPAEMTAVILLALTSIGWLLGDNPVQGLVSTGVGLMLATIGVDLARGISRYHFGFNEMLSGLTFIPLVIGMFGFSQVMTLMESYGSREDDELRESLSGKKLTIRDSLLTKKEMLSLMPAIGRAGVLGTFIGVLPGAGATMSSFLTYILEKRTGKYGAEMGEGSIHGVAVPESGNNAAAAGAFAPLLSLGIPGSGTTAVLLGGLMMWGLQPGPLLFTQHPDFAWGLIASMYVGNIICLAMSILCIPWMVHILRVPNRIIIPIVSVVCIVGSYTINNSLFDVSVMLIAGVFGYFLQHNNYPVAPLLLAFVLSPILEKSLRGAFEISGGSFSIFFKSPITMGFLGLTVLLCSYPVVKKLFARKA